MIKRLISSLLIIIVITLFLFGCSRKVQDEDEVTLRYMIWGCFEFSEAAKNIIMLFEKKYPGIKVKLEIPPRDYWVKLQTMFAGGMAPDVMLMSGSNYVMLTKKGCLKDITPFIERDKVNLRDYYKTVVDCFTYKGRMYALPLDCKTVALYYNKTMFDKENVPYPDENWKWEDLVDAAQKLTKDNNNDGKIDQWGLWFPGRMDLGWGNFVWQNKGQILNEGKTKCLLDKPEAIEAIQFQKDLYWKHKVTPSPTMDASGISAAVDPFMSGKIGMKMEGAWMTALYRSINNFDWDVARLPMGKVRAVSVNGLAHSVYEKTKYPEEAWKLVKFLSSPPAQEIYAKTGRAIPILKKIANSEIYLNPKLKPYNKKVFLDEMEYAHDLEFTANWNEWMDAVENEFTLIWLDNVSVEEGCKRAARRVNKLLEEVSEK